MVKVMKFFKCSQCGYGYFWRSLINSIFLYARNRLIIKWYFVGERTKNYFLKWTPLFISKYRVKYLNIFSYSTRNIFVAASSMPFNLIATPV